jgi:hypothetical protein
MAEDIRTSDEIMNSILGSFESIKEDWEKVKERKSKAASRRIRKELDGIAKIKVELRKAMIREENK